MMGTWENLKIIKKNVMDGLSHSDVLECAMFSVRITAAQGDKFSRSCSSSFCRAKTDIFLLYSSYQSNPELCFDLEESKHNL